MPAEGRVLLVVLLVLLGTLAGCSDDSAGQGLDASAPSAPSSAPSGDVVPKDLQYAALGDSFTAAPFVPRTDLADGCFRSSGNYPSLLSSELEMRKVRDVSCSGADTDDVAGRQVVAGGRGTVPPQINAVTTGTDLVTLGIGGNDEDLFATLIGMCTSPAESAGAGCLDRSEQANETGAVLRRTTARVTQDLRLVHDRAPDARVVLIGYPRLVAPAHPCAKIPLAEGDLAGLAALEQDLRDALADAARNGDADFVDLYALSEGHEICSDAPWVNGSVTDETRALAYHPFAVGQQAVADEIAELLREDSP